MSFGTYTTALVHPCISCLQLAVRLCAGQIFTPKPTNISHTNFKNQLLLKFVSEVFELNDWKRLFDCTHSCALSICLPSEVNKFHYTCRPAHVWICFANRISIWWSVNDINRVGSRMHRYFNTNNGNIRSNKIYIDNFKILITCLLELLKVLLISSRFILDYLYSSRILTRYVNYYFYNND